MPCEAVNRGATLLFMGAASWVCGSGDGSVLEVLFNIQLDPNVFKLCGKLKRCYNTACTNAYGTKDMHDSISELKLWCNELSGGGDAYGIARGKSQLGTLQCGWLEGQRLTDSLGQNGPFYKVWGTVLRMHEVTKMWPPADVVHGTTTMGNERLKGTCHTR